MYKISIIVPVFNVEDTIENAFDSILNQSIGFENLEVIFVDDKSTDNSASILKELSDNHENVKAFYLDENSGFAGKPRNIGIENATADYLMFLDPDDVFLKDACELLYENIAENDLDLVSGNYNINRDNKITRNDWNIIKLHDNEYIQVQSVDENFNLLLTTPSVWSKIFKKDFILKENIEFLVGVPAQDLVFVSEALLKANGIKFINTPVVEYTPRENDSVTSKKSKRVLGGFIKSYTAVLNIAKEYDEDYAWLGPRNLFFWIKQFCLSDLSLTDKIDLLHMANPLFKEFINSNKINPPEFLEEFLDSIARRDFLNASKISEELDIFYDEKILLEKVKEKRIFQLFFGFDMEIGGLAKATFNRANLLREHGYEVTLINIDKLRNCEYIANYLYKNKYLDESIDVINVYDYFSAKNTLDYSASPEPKNENLQTESDQSLTLKHYDRENLLKTERYFKNYYCIKTYVKNKINNECFYTNDGFKYLTIHDEYGPVTFNDRTLDLKIDFKDIFEFHDYFVSEILINYGDKSFLINENSGIVPDFNNVDSSIAYKIASIHTNPYSGEHHYGSPIRGDFTILSKVNELDYVVVLTEGLKSDLVKEFGIDRIAAIPNIVDTAQYAIDGNSEKDLNKFSIFARLSPEKNISDVIKAFDIVSRQNDDARLEIFGRAITLPEINEERRLKELVGELKLEGRATFKGHTDNVSEEMSTSLATLFTSEFEGLGMVVLESMLNSTPVISYDIHYGPSDYIKHGETGYLIRQGDFEGLAECMLDMLDNPDKAIEMGELAHKNVLKQIDEENLFMKWEDVLKEAYINSQNSRKNHLIDTALLNELDRLERVKIKLYKENHRLYKQNKLLKKQINSKKTNLKDIFKKLKFI